MAGMEELQDPYIRAMSMASTTRIRITREDSKGVNGSGPIIGGFAAHAPGVTAVGASVGVSLLGGPFTFGVNRTEYTKPLQLGRFWAFDEKAYVMFLGRQVACR